MREKHYNIPVFIPNAACPHQCIFCSQKNISGSVKSPSTDEMKGIIDKYLSTITGEGNIEIAFFGGTFTGLPLAEQEKYLRAVQDYINTGRVRGIRISTRPDCINREILTLLKSYNVTAIELGAQSMDAEVLELSERGHSSIDIIRASEMIKDENFSLGLQMMIGLPGDTLEKAVSTAESIANLEPETARIYPTLVIKDTILEKLFLKKKYTPLSLNEAVEWTAHILHIFEKHRINVIRIGLHPSEGLISGSSLLAGPFHQSFRELVLTEIWKKLFEPLLLIPENKELTISVRPEEYNYAVGYKARNKEMLASKFRSVIFKTDISIKSGRNFNAVYN